MAIQRVQANVDDTKTSTPNDEFNAEREFRRLIDRFHQGHCLITVATGVMSDAKADRAGLVPTHAYALLDIREAQVLLRCMLIVFV